jgi:hypothetical protein
MCGEYRGSAQFEIYNESAVYYRSERRNSMKCPECGATVGDEEKFCGECGAPIEPAPEASAQEPEIESSEETVYAAPAVVVESTPVPGEIPASEPVIPAEPPPPVQEPDFAPPPPFTPPPQSAGSTSPPPPVIPAAPAAKGKNNTVLIIVIVAVVLLLLCCCCVGGIVIFLNTQAGQDFMNEISMVLPALSAML